MNGSGPSYRWLTLASLDCLALALVPGAVAATLRGEFSGQVYITWPAPPSLLLSLALAWIGGKIFLAALRAPGTEAGAS